MPAGEVTSSEQVQPIIDDTAPILTNQQEDSTNLRQDDYILKPANQNQTLMTNRPAKKQSKKSVSMCETVSVLDATGQVNIKSASLKSGDMDVDGQKKRSMDETVDTHGEENCCQDAGQTMRDSRGARHGGKKHHKVVHMKSNNAAECKQQ